MERISKILRLQMDDIGDLYTQARNDENAPAMERLARATANMARKIRDQETHERETISRTEFLRAIGDVGEAIGSAHNLIPDDKLRTEVIDKISDGIAEIAERVFTPDV